MLAINVKIKRCIALQNWGIRSIGLLGSLLQCRTNYKENGKLFSTDVNICRN